MEVITSRHISLCVHIRKLGAERKYRRAQGQFLCEGDKLVEEALRWNGGVETLLCAEGSPVPAGIPEGVRLVQVPSELLESLSTVETPQRLLAVCRMPERRMPEILPWESYLVLDGLQDPGNVGTIWRTADALGAAGVFLLPGCADPFSPKTVRSTMGACFRLPVWETRLEELCPRLEKAGIPRMPPLCGRTRWMCGRSPCPGRRWSSAVRAVGSPPGRWSDAPRRCASPCGSGANP